jgi:hypothetical protein
MRRFLALSSGLDKFFAAQFSAGYITNMSGFDLRQAQHCMAGFTVHIVITGRTHAWRPKTDFDLCERHIGFPSWFPAFYGAQRQVARDVILREIEHELASGLPSQDSHYVLSDISWSAGRSDLFSHQRRGRETVRGAFA